MPKVISQVRVGTQSLWSFALHLPQSAGKLRFTLRFNNGRMEAPYYQGEGVVRWNFLTVGPSERFRIVVTAGLGTRPEDVPAILQALELGGEFGAEDHRRISQTPHHETGADELGELWRTQGFWYVGIDPEYLGPMAEGGRKSIAAGVSWKHEW